jgi:hypothetical protein
MAKFKRLKIDTWVVTGQGKDSDTFVVGVFSSKRRAATAARVRFEKLGREFGYTYAIEPHTLNARSV